MLQVYFAEFVRLVFTALDVEGEDDQRPMLEVFRTRYDGVDNQTLYSAVCLLRFAISEVRLAIYDQYGIDEETRVAFIDCINGFDRCVSMKGLKTPAGRMLKYCDARQLGQLELVSTLLEQDLKTSPPSGGSGTPWIRRAIRNVAPATQLRKVYGVLKEAKEAKDIYEMLEKAQPYIEKIVEALKELFR